MLKKGKDKKRGKRDPRKSQKRDPRMGTVVRKNGKLFKDRVCPECGCKHWHGSSTCITCENALHKKRYGYHYLKRKETVWYSDREKRIVAHTERIERETAAIEAAGLNIDEYSCEEIEKVMAGKLPVDKARKVIENE